MNTPLKGLLLALCCLLLLAAAGSAFAQQKRVVAIKTVTVAMHDPGCHWFSVGGKFTKTLTVKGPVALANYDEAALKVARAGSVVRDRVGHRVVLSRGSYRITMVGQAPDDNTLKLVVR